MTNLILSIAETEKEMVGRQIAATQTVATVRASQPTLIHRAAPLFTAVKSVKEGLEGSLNQKLLQLATISLNTARVTTQSLERAHIRAVFRAAW